MFVCLYISRTDLIFSKLFSKGGDFPKHHRDRLVISFATSQTRLTRFGPKVGQTDPNGTNPELFQLIIQYLLAFWLGKRNCTEMWFENVSDLSPLGANLTNNGPESDIPVRNNSLHTNAQTLDVVQPDTITQSLLWAVLGDWSHSQAFYSMKGEISIQTCFNIVNCFCLFFWNFISYRGVARVTGRSELSWLLVAIEAKLVCTHCDFPRIINISKCTLTSPIVYLGRYNCIDDWITRCEMT